MDSDLRTKITNSWRTGEDFTKLYYGSFDRRRHHISLLYLDQAVFVWNGNPANGKNHIQQCFNELPPTDHSLITLDIQPIVDQAVNGQLTYMIVAGGTVRYADAPARPFQQTFIITAQNDKWKIVSDVYRFQDAFFQ